MNYPEIRNICPGLFWKVYNDKTRKISATYVYTRKEDHIINSSKSIDGCNIKYYVHLQICSCTNPEIQILYACIFYPKDCNDKHTDSLSKYSYLWGIATLQITSQQKAVQQWRRTREALMSGSARQGHCYYEKCMGLVNICSEHALLLNYVGIGNIHIFRVFLILVFYV